MIDTTPSLEAAEGLTGRAVADYLRGRGWLPTPSRMDGFLILSKSIPGADRPIEIIVPVRPGFSEEHRRVADALRTLSQLGGISVFRAADEVRQGGADESGEHRQLLSGFREE